MRRLALAALLLVACKDDEPRSIPQTPAATPSEIASALHVDASALEAPVDPPPPSGDLREELASFTTVDACVKSRAGLDPLLGDALESIGYETFVVDACRMLDALKAKSAKKCEPIDASMLRARCERLAAIAAGDADACPMAVIGRPQYGRDATCVAAALRAPSMCAGEQALERASCFAFVGKDDKPCNSIGRPTNRTRCLRDAHRFAPLLDEKSEGAKPPELPKVESKLTIDPLGGDASDAGATAADLADDVSRGVVLVDSRDRVRFDLGESHEAGLGLLPPMPLARPHMAVSVETSATGKTTRVEHAELGVPGLATFVYPGARAELKVTIEKLERVRGGALKLVVEGEMGTTGHGDKVRWEVSTFVRDVVGLSAFAQSSPALGRDGGARAP